MTRTGARASFGALVMIISCLAVLQPLARAEESVEPYIDSIRQELRAKGVEAGPPAATPVVDPFIQEQKAKLQKNAPPEAGGSYIDQVRQNDPDARPPAPQTGPSFTEQQKQKLPPAQPGGAIEAFREGKSELHMRKEGPIRFAGGFRVATVLNRDLTNEAGATFEASYGSKWIPDFTIFFEYQPWHSEFWGNFGLVAQGGFSQAKGTGKFAINLPGFGTTSRTQFLFLSYPFTAAINYRFNVLRILRPYFQAGPTVIGYNETRNDHREGHRGYSTGYTVNGGINIDLDWVSKELSWDLYQEAGVKQYFLTIDYMKMLSVAGPVHFDESGFSAGLTYEF